MICTFLLRRIKHLIDDASVRKTASLSCDVPCVVLPEQNWKLNLSAVSQIIVFIDEDHPALAEGEKLAFLMKQSDNCFMIISRDRMPWLPYSYRETYKIRSSGKYHTLKRIHEKIEDFVEINCFYNTISSPHCFFFYPPIKKTASVSRCYSS